MKIFVSPLLSTSKYIQNIYTYIPPQQIYIYAQSQAQRWNTVVIIILFFSTVQGSGALRPSCTCVPASAPKNIADYLLIHLRELQEDRQLMAHPLPTKKFSTV